MKKLTICLALLLLTGCQSSYEVREMEGNQHSITLEASSNKITKEVDDSDWESLVAALDKLENSMNANFFSYYTSNYQENGRDMIVVDDMLRIYIIEDISKKQLEIIEAKIGEAFDDFMSKESLVSLEAGRGKEMVIGQYGLALNKGNGNDVELGICKSSIELENEAQQAWAETICGNDMLLSAVSYGEQGSIIEFSNPHKMMQDRMCYGNSGIKIYYHLYRDKEEQANKIRVVYRANQYQDNKLTEAQLASLGRLIKGVTGQEEDLSTIGKEINQALSGSSKKSQGRIGTLSYEMTNNETINGGKMVVIDFKVS